MLRTKLFKEFFASEKSGGLVLIVVTIVSLFLANSIVGESLIHFFHQKFFGLSVEHWVNDGLMFVFFLMIGLELEREIYEGELSSWRNAALPVFAAVGGMIVPAAIHFAFNSGTPTQRGAGIPMATALLDRRSRYVVVSFAFRRTRHDWGRAPGICHPFFQGNPRVRIAPASTSASLPRRFGNIADFRIGQHLHSYWG